MYGVHVLLLTVVLAVQASDDAYDADESLVSEEILDATRIDDEIYCGLYCVYGALRAIGNDVAIGHLLKPEYLASFEGSNLAELRAAAVGHGAHAVAMSGMSIALLKHCDLPVILHVRSNRSTRSFNHWILFLGVEQGKLRVIDPPGSLELVSPAELLARWDCTGLVLSNRPLETTSLIWVTQLPLMGALAAIVLAIFSLRRFFRSRNWSTLLPALTIRHTLRATAGQAVVITLLSLFIGAIVHALGSNGFISNPDAVASVIKCYHSTFLPKLEYTDVKALLGRHDTVLIDARFPPDYDAGHIPGALNLPVNATLSEYQMIRDLVQGKALIVIYCQSIGCGFDEEVANQLSFAGVSGIRLYPGGWADWKDHEHDGD